MALSSQAEINLPGMQSKCTASLFQKYKRSCSLQTNPCSKCKYWPIYPCYQSKKPMVECLVDYLDDPIASSRNNPETISTTLNMYSALVNEGHDVRMMRFKASGSQRGGHKNPQNYEYWQVACFGITASCSSKCENSFVNCAKQNGFKSCISENNNLKGCQKDCSPTFKMMSQSETPDVSKFSKGIFGANTQKNLAKPKTSICNA